MQATVCGGSVIKLGPTGKLHGSTAGADKSAENVTSNDAQNEQKSTTVEGENTSHQSAESFILDVHEHDETWQSREMFPPGWILHLQQTSEQRRCFDRGCANGCLCTTLGLGNRTLKPVWLRQDALREIVVSRRMSSDHFPDRVMAALQTVRPDI